MKILDDSGIFFAQTLFKKYFYEIFVGKIVSRKTQKKKTIIKPPAYPLLPKMGPYFTALTSNCYNFGNYWNFNIVKDKIF